MRPLAFCTLLLALLPLHADAKDYWAERFDSRIEVAYGGALRVTETVRLRFEDGPFTQFFREIPSRLTDGIAVVSSTMDDEALAPGDQAGQFQVRSGSSLRVTWHFAPVSHATHVFVLTYVVRGVVRQGDGADTVAWRAFPTQ